MIPATVVFAAEDETANPAASHLGVIGTGEAAKLAVARLSGLADLRSVGNMHRSRSSGHLRPERGDAISDRLLMLQLRNDLVGIGVQPFQTLVLLVGAILELVQLVEFCSDSSCTVLKVFDFAGHPWPPVVSGGIQSCSHIRGR